MSSLSYSNFSNFLLFPDTFIPGGIFFPAPRYAVDQVSGAIEYTRLITNASTGYYNINPAIRLSGPNLTLGPDNLVSGQIDTIVFRSDNRGTIATLSELDLQGSAFSAVLQSRLNGDATSGGQFNEMLGKALGSITFTDDGESVSVSRLMDYLDQIDLGGGDDTALMSRPDSTGLLIKGGAGRDILSLSDFGRPELFDVDLENGIVRTDDTFFRFQDFEVIRGNPYVDRYLGSSGRDIIEAAGRDDIILAGAGRDRLSAGWGDDFVRAGGGNDWVDAGPGADKVIGGPGKDTIKGGEGDDIIRGSAGNDLLRGQSGADQIWGGSGSDTINGMLGNDVVIGGPGRDVIDMGRGDDRYIDTNQSGFSGNDIITGGGGQDTFVFGSVISNDVITDFKPGTDTLELDRDLWAEDLSAAQVVDNFARSVGGKVVLKFADGQKITLEGLETFVGLADDLVLV